MDEHEKAADLILDEEWKQQIPANAFYFAGSLIISFLIVLGLLAVFAK
jgi:hypothetical protein